VQGYNSGDPTSFVTYERGYGAGKIGGMNVNSFTLTYQAIKDAERGKGGETRGGKARTSRPAESGSTDTANASNSSGQAGRRRR
jgi:hypothetical protein